MRERENILNKWKSKFPSCYNKFYKTKLTVVGYKKYLGSHTRLELLFMGLVGKIATWGFYTPNASALPMIWTQMPTRKNEQ